MPTGSGLWHFL